MIPGKQSQLKISILGFSKEEVDTDGKKVTLYQISISNPMHNWKVKRRYNEFYELHEHLAVNFKVLPKIPQKTFFAVSSDAQIEKRRVELEKYLNELLEVELILQNLHFAAFLKVEQHFPDNMCARPMVLCNYQTASSLTFTDINYEEDRSLNYVLCSKGVQKPSDAANLPKVDGLKSQNSGTESGVLHKSILNGFQFDPNDPMNIFQDKRVVKTFDVKAHCLAYFAEAAVIVAGFSQGIISVYKEEKKFKTEDEYQLSNLAKIKASNDRITKILMNKKKGQMYAIARTNKISIIDMATWTTKETIKIGTSPILAIHIDESYDLGVSTTEDGKLHVIDIAGDRPVVSKTLPITTKGRLSCMEADIDSGKVVMACYETGEIFLVDIEFPFTPVNLQLT